jgi:hypothetical protein
MDATTYTGNGSTQTITNAAGFRPDLVWYKGRSFAYNHGWFDSVRGATNYLASNLTDAAISISGVTSFNSNGFTLGSSGNGNNSGTTYVGWQWQAGQGSSSSNTSGTITSQVSVNAAAGFSVVTYTGNGTAGATVGHGLGVAPKMIVVKVRSTGADWYVYHAGMASPKDNVMYLNATNGNTASSVWNNTAPASSVFSLGNAGAVNGSGSTFVAYCWAEIDGFSKFGSYTGNGSTDGPFIYTGFRPKWVMVKWSSAGGTNWNIVDTSRDTFNEEQKFLAANAADTEGTLAFLDGLSNGFKIRTSAGAQNSNGGTYIYMAFAENPFKNSLAR